MGGPAYYALKRQDQERKAMERLYNIPNKLWVVSVGLACISLLSSVSAYQSYQEYKTKTSMEQSQTVTNITTNLESTVEAGK